MPRAIQITAYGGPEVMKIVDLPVGDPGPGEIRIRQHACGLNPAFRTAGRTPTVSTRPAAGTAARTRMATGAAIIRSTSPGRIRRMR